MLDCLDPQRRVHQGQAKTGQPGTCQGKSGTGCQPQHDQAHRFDAHAGDCHVVATKAADAVGKDQAAEDKAHAKYRQAIRRTFPALVDIKQGDKGSQRAITNRGQGQADAIGGNKAEYRPKRQAHARDRGDCRFVANQPQGGEGQQQQGHTQHGEAQPLDHHHAQRCTYGDRAVGGNAIPANGSGGML